MTKCVRIDALETLVNIETSSAYNMQNIVFKDDIFAGAKEPRPIARVQEREQANAEDTNVPMFSSVSSASIRTNLIMHNVLDPSEIRNDFRQGRSSAKLERPSRASTA
jgi:hypothetical protein